MVARQTSDVARCYGGTHITQKLLSSVLAADCRNHSMPETAFSVRRPTCDVRPLTNNHQNYSS